MLKRADIFGYIHQNRNQFGFYQSSNKPVEAYWRVGLIWQNIFLSGGYSREMGACSRIYGSLFHLVSF